MEELKMIAQFGIGGAIAALIFHFYRTDRKASEERYATDRLKSEERYEALALNFRAIVTENTVASTENTAASRELIGEIRHLFTQNGNRK